MVKYITWTKDFKKTVQSIKNKPLKGKLAKKLEKIINDPKIGKPLRYSLKGERSIRFDPYRIIYAFNKNELFLLRLQHRGKAYKPKN